MPKRFSIACVALELNYERYVGSVLESWVLSILESKFPSVTYFGVLLISIHLDQDLCYVQFHVCIHFKGWTFLLVRQPKL